MVNVCQATGLFASWNVYSVIPRNLLLEQHTLLTPYYFPYDIIPNLSDSKKCCFFINNLQDEQTSRSDGVSGWSIVGSVEGRSFTNMRLPGWNPDMTATNVWSENPFKYSPVLPLGKGTPPPWGRATLWSGAAACWEPGSRWWWGRPVWSCLETTSGPPGRATPPLENTQSIRAGRGGAADQVQNTIPILFMLLLLWSCGDLSTCKWTAG